MENWRDVLGYEGLYKVSNMGNVISLVTRRKNKLLSPSFDKYGYKILTICKNGKKQTLRLHRMIALAFLPPIEGKTVINHINGIKTDNSLINLEWVTLSENIKHAVEVLYVKGVTVTTDENLINKIKSLHEAPSGLSPKRISVQLSIPISMVDRVLKTGFHKTK